jgi:HD-GYP domain-containing protein (c-di-GMP phosphodiesterase class II)
MFACYICPLIEVKGWLGPHCSRNKGAPLCNKPAHTFGLELYRTGASIETVRSRSGEVSLRVLEPELELMEGSLQVGERLTVLPASFGQDCGTEVYYLLEGLLRVDTAEAETLGPGDIIVARKLQEPVIFTVQRDVKFLCVTNRPTFHEVSGTLQDLKRLADEVEQKDKGAVEHCKRVRDLSLQMGRRLGLPAHRLFLLDYSAYLHDVGKVKVPLEILLKPGSLTAEEWDVIKRHPSYGRALVENTFMKDVGPIIEQHHERFDGSGYPHGLAGEDILLESYIVAVADAFDAMTTDRPYHLAMTQQQAVAEIEQGSGRFYPDKVVQALLASIE